MKTDLQLQRDVAEELDCEPALNAARIGVVVQAGAVIMVGSVANYADKRSAEHAALRVSGVLTLCSELSVELEHADMRSDAEVAASVEQALQWSTKLAEGAITINVNCGWVTLNGVVDWQYQKQAAASAVHHVHGVVGVTDLIELRPHVSALDIQTEIEAALKQLARGDSRQLHVAVDGSRVVLTGAAHSSSERDAAMRSAWGAPGVQDVVDSMTSTY